MNKIKFPEQIKTKRTVLKRHPLTVDHAKQMFGFIVSNKAQFEKALPFMHRVNSPKDSYDWIDFSNKKMDEGSGCEYMITVDGKYVGNFGLPKIDYDNKKVSLGIWMDKSAEGKWYPIEIYRVMEKFLFDLDFNMLIIEHFKSNPITGVIAKRLGFIEGGLLRNSFYNVCLDRFEDKIQYTKLRSEYLKEQKVKNEKINK